MGAVMVPVQHLFFGRSVENWKIITDPSGL